MNLDRIPKKKSWAVVGILIGFFGVVGIGGVTVWSHRSDKEDLQEEKPDTVAQEDENFEKETSQATETLDTDKSKTKPQRVQITLKTEPGSDKEEEEDTISENFSEWTEADYLKARQDQNPLLLQAVAHLAKTGVGKEETVDLLKKLIHFDPEKEKEAPPVEVVWIDDAVPEGAQVGVNEGNHPWQWLIEPHPVFSGSKVMYRDAKGLSQHFFSEATKQLAIDRGDKLFAYVYLDPKNLPKTIMLQFNDGSWEHRAYWGQNKILYGKDNTPSKVAMGKLPQGGNWARLEIEAVKVGLKPGAKLNGWAFTQFDGKAYYDKAGVQKSPSDLLVPKVIQALASYNNPAVLKTLKSLLSGKFKTRLPEEQVVALTLKAVASNVQSEKGRNKPLEDLLMVALSEPNQIRPITTKGMSGDLLQKMALELFQPVATRELRTSLAKRMLNETSTDEQLARLVEFLAEPIADNFDAQLMLYQQNFLDRKPQLLYTEAFTLLSGAALKHVLGLIKPGDKTDHAVGRIATKEDALHIANKLWSEEFSESVLNQFSQSTDIRAAPRALLLASTMPTRPARKAVSNHFLSVGSNHPGPFTGLDAFDKVMVDPALLVLMKPIWHRPGVLRMLEDNVVPPQWNWAKAGEKLLGRFIQGFADLAQPGSGNLTPPYKLHPNAKVKSHYVLSWPGEQQENLPKLDLARLEVRYFRIEDLKDLSAAKRIYRHYKTQAKLDAGATTVTFPIPRGNWIDSLGHVPNTSRIRSIDVVLILKEPTEEAKKKVADQVAALKRATDHLKHMRDKMKKKNEELKNDGLELQKTLVEAAAEKDRKKREGKLKHAENIRKRSINHAKQRADIGRKISAASGNVVKARGALSPVEAKIIIEFLVIEIPQPPRR